MSHEVLVEVAEDAISGVFSDTSVEPNKTKDSLEDLALHIQTLLATLPD